eukprot:2742167-Amphidinium_carterae.1
MSPVLSHAINTCSAQSALSSNLSHAQTGSLDDISIDYLLKSFICSPTHVRWCALEEADWDEVHGAELTT